MLFIISFHTPYSARAWDSGRGISEESGKEYWLYVALPTYNVEEPRLPLKLGEQRNLFKLFMSDVGLLASSSWLKVLSIAA